MVLRLIDGYVWIACVEFYVAKADCLRSLHCGLSIVRDNCGEQKVRLQLIAKHRLRLGL
jgi:hypothetical protein